MTLFSGVGAAMVTPFGKSGAIDRDVLDAYVEHLISGGVSALFPFGTTGEPATLSAAEYSETLEHIVRRVRSRVPVIAGAGSNSTEAACKHAATAKKAGADGALVVTPYYNKCTQSGMIAHYKAIAEIGLPIIVYNVPSRTGVNIEPETLETLATVRGIVGIKEASGDINRLQRTAKVCAETGLDLYCGDDGLTVVAMALGGKGVISVAANPAPAIMKKLITLCEENDFSAARELQFKLFDFINALFCEVNPIPVKKAMQLLGFDVGAPRLPLTELEPQHIKLLEKTMREVGLL